MDLKIFLETIFSKYKTGYFICEVDGLSSFIFNDYKKKEITIHFASQDISVLELKEFFESQGKEVTMEKSSNEGLILEPAIIENTEFNEITSKEIYLVKEHQLTPMNELMLQMEENGIVENITPITISPEKKKKQTMQKK